MHTHIFLHFSVILILSKIQEVIMKTADKNKRIRTAPKGAWESGIINEKKNRSKKQRLNDITTDLQGNGYPVSHENRDN